MRVLAAVIAGGLSSRMGREKAFVELSGKPLIAHVIDRLTPQADGIIINANGPRWRFSVFGLTVVPDLLTDVGTPLAGLHAALRYGCDRRFDAVLTVPSDTPFLPPDLAARLSQSLPSIAASDGHDHFLTGLWPAELYGMLDVELSRGLRRVQDFAMLVAASRVTWQDSADPFFNINTPEDLAAAEARHGD
jgi:molybdenum cofactor guanylyltransferase